ncbi:MAG: nucleoid-associated protein [Bacteroidales bacterium]|nr:nucleoid-associated protein [Bacteroidales bacterium]
MINIENAYLSKLIIHRVGNKVLEDGLTLSDELVSLSEAYLSSLGGPLLVPFGKEDLLYNFYHDTDVNLNVMFTRCKKIFRSPDEEFIEASVAAAKELYELMQNPKLHGGEFWVAYFKGIVVDDEETDAVAFYLMDERKNFVKLYNKETNYAIEMQSGTDPSGFLSGCLICNMALDEGFIVSATGKSKSLDLRMWMDVFMILKQNIDSFYRTQLAMRMCKDFVMEKMPEEFETTRPDQAELLIKSMDFFKASDEFALKNFQEDVLKQPELKDSFTHFAKQFSREQDLNMGENFLVNERAVKKMARHFKSVIKLDTNFHIYVHGRREWIERGFDEEKKLNFYKTYFEKED